MRDFNGKVFLTVFTIGLAIPSLYFGLLALTPARSPSIAANVLVSIMVLVVALAMLGACYHYPIRWSRATTRAIMGWIVKRAIRASLSHAMIPVKCLGIMPKEGTVALRINYGETDGAKLDMWFNVHDCVNNELWGQVRIAETNELTSLCEPSNRDNEDFWEHLEQRMRFDTSPPNVYLIREIPPQILESVDELLNNWR